MRSSDSRWATPERAEPPLRRSTLARVGCLLLLFVLAAPSVRAEGGAAPASAAIERLHAALLDVMQHAASLGYEGRARRLAPVVAAVYDIPTMARIAVGKYWKDLSPDDQQRLTDAFARFTVANYAGRFDGYSGERFEMLGEEDAPQGLRLVRTRLVPAEGEVVRLDYRLRSTPDGWRIVDVFLNGTVSELALRRAQYTAVIERDGFPALLEALDKKIADLASGNEKGPPS